MIIPQQAMSREILYCKAIRYYLKILENSPAYSLCYYNIGKLYLAMGDHGNAAYYFEKFLDNSKSDPMQPFAKKMLERIKATNNDILRKEKCGRT
jgi:tetratricopeptide (TPR) repeat protein